MRIQRIIPVCAAVVAALLLHNPAAAEGLGQIADSSGGHPSTALVEMPQDALLLWRTQGVREKAVLLISEDLPISRMEDSDVEFIMKEIDEGRWDQVAAPGHMSPYTFPVNRASYLYVAFRAGIISGICWVPPTNNPADTEPPESLNSYFRAMGVAEPELKALIRKDGSITGTLNGIPVRIFNMQNIHGLEDEVLLDVDLSFFGPFYKDEVRTPLITLLGKFMRTLSESGVKAGGAVVSLSTIDKTVPLERRFIGGYLKRFFEKPDELADGPPAEWRLRSEAMYREEFFQPEEVLRLYREASELAPGDASLKFDLATGYYLSKNAEAMKRELDKAVCIDRGYYPAYIRYSKYFAGQEMPGTALDFADDAVAVAPEDPDSWLALRAAQRAAGNFEEAAAAQKKVIGFGFDGPIPLYDLAQDYADAGDYGRAIENYIKALGMIPVLDTDNRPRFLIGLAEAYEKSGRIQDALDTYGLAIDASLDQHAKAQTIQKRDALLNKWAPFMKGGGR